MPDWEFVIPAVKLIKPRCL